MKKDSISNQRVPTIVLIQNFLSERYKFRLDIVANILEYSPVEFDDYRELNENNILCELYEAGFTRFKDQFKALLRSSHVPEYDPFVAYYESLPKWDESQPDYIAQLASYVSVNNPEWFERMFKKMLVRVAACATGKAKFNKQCFVFVGGQNDGKTSFLRFLCPPALRKYYKENIDFESKDGRIALAENLLINLDELSSLSKSDSNKFKAYLTEEIVKVRRPYAERETSMGRRASFVGSTNQREFLNDETGNVRWLVFDVNGINHDNGGPNGYGADIDINNVWAQAYALLQNGFQYEMTREEIRESERNNLGYQRTTEEIDLLNHYYAPSERGAHKAEFLTTTEIARRLIILSDNKLRVNTNNVGKALRFLGFQPVSMRREGSPIPVKGYWVLQKQGSESFQ